MSIYKISRVSDKPPREWAFGNPPVEMKTYKVLLEGVEGSVDVNRKASGPAPAVGEELSGTIEDSEYGQKFKADRKPYSPKAAGMGSFKGGASSATTRAMYTAYAKDIAVALIAKEGNIDNQLFESIIEAIAKAGTVLYKAAEETPTTKPDKTSNAWEAAREKFKPKETPVEEETIDLSDIPF